MAEPHACVRFTVIEHIDKAVISKGVKQTYFVLFTLQMLCLDRLVNGDLMTARQLLELMLASRHLTTPAAIPEYAPFAYSLASVLQDLVKGKQLSATSGFWEVAVGKVLLALVDSDSQVILALVTCNSKIMLLLDCW